MKPARNGWELNPGSMSPHLCKTSKVGQPPNGQAWRTSFSRVDNSTAATWSPLGERSVPTRFCQIEINSVFQNMELVVYIIVTCMFHITEYRMLMWNSLLKTSWLCSSFCFQIVGFEVGLMRPWRRSLA